MAYLENKEYKVKQDIILEKQKPKKTKFTDEEVFFMIEHKKEHSLSEVVKLFVEKYNKSVTKAYISKLN